MKFDGSYFCVFYYLVFLPADAMDIFNKSESKITPNLWVMYVQKLTLLSCVCGVFFLISLPQIQCSSIQLVVSWKACIASQWHNVRFPQQQRRHYSAGGPSLNTEALWESTCVRVRDKHRVCKYASICVCGTHNWCKCGLVKPEPSRCPAVAPHRQLSRENQITD